MSKLIDRNIMPMNFINDGKANHILSIETDAVGANTIDWLINRF